MQLRQEALPGDGGESFLIPGEVTFGREEEVQRRTMLVAASLCSLPQQQCGYQPRGAHTFPGCLPNPGAGLANGAFAFPELFNIPLEQVIVSGVRQEPFPSPSHCSTSCR